MRPEGGNGGPPRTRPALGRGRRPRRLACAAWRRRQRSGASDQRNMTRSLHFGPIRTIRRIGSRNYLAAPNWLGLLEVVIGPISEGPWFNGVITCASAASPSTQRSGSPWYAWRRLGHAWYLRLDPSRPRQPSRSCIRQHRQVPRRSSAGAPRIGPATSSRRPAIRESPAHGWCPLSAPARRRRTRPCGLGSTASATAR